MYKYHWIIVLSLGISLLNGCGPANPYGTIPVKGSVVLDGKPVQGVNVMFVPTNPNGMGASGLTDDKGTYVLTTGGAPFGTGATPGEYDVTFSKVSNEGAGKPTSVDDFNAGLASGTASSRAPKAVHLIPQKYSLQTTSGIKPVVVEKGKPNDFKFELLSEK